MIFKKILKSTDLTLDMSLEKRQYRPGERVRGTLSIKTEKASKATQLILFAEGKESTIITASESTGAGSSSSPDTTTRTYREINTFFSKDLSHLLQESVSCNILQDGTLEILPQNKVIPFDFTLPDDNNLFSSYKGKHANITYTVKRTADITKNLDVNKEEQFSVINYNNKMVTYSSNSSFGGENKNDTINATTIENQNNISPSTIIEGEEKDADKENYEARFEQIFGKQANRTSPQDRPRRYFTFSGMSMNFDLGTIFDKGREHFLKENSEAKIDLLDHKNNNAPYSPGHTVKGEVILLLPSNEEQEEMRQKIRGMKITLSGVENAFAQGLQRVSTIEKYEKIIELNGNENGGNEDDNNDNTIPFEFEIPQDVNQSYLGKYSEYFWGIEAKLNIAWSSDINARTIIDVV
jgi:antitoxin component of RelBE/YafQ-DinJ toxin-antitoxin module